MYHNCPVHNKHRSVGRDSENERLRTGSLLAAINLHNRNVIPMVNERHRSKEFIEFLKKLDGLYPKDWKLE
ncbi:hypothetical protein K4L44_07700 [Halosquirtibacter laminarini]|uniref:Uncharacterized protein n=1 Tax=Halosquirtibacter laminarini TaxID=3374600 RepID=A0AC61NPA9_9BACT|nr:hypothetical protein K4L44_07700 [Prolixibacteraceae bacterium]